METAQCYNAKKKTRIIFIYSVLSILFSCIHRLRFIFSLFWCVVCVYDGLSLLLHFILHFFSCHVSVYDLSHYDVAIIDSVTMAHTHTPKSISINRVVGCRHRHHCLAMATIRLHRWIRIVIVWLHIISSFPQHLAISFSLILALSLNPFLILSSIRYTINIRNMKNELDCWSYAVRTLSNKKQNIKIQ